VPEPNHETVLQRQQAFGYTHEDLRLLLGPMATAGEEPVGSMGTDTSLAVLSNRPRAALRLLQAALRPGDESAPGRDPRGAGHPDRDHHRTGGESPRAHAGGGASAQAEDAHPQQRGGRARPSFRRPRLPVRHHPDGVSRGGGRRRPRPRAGGGVRAGEPGGPRRLDLSHPVRPRGEREAGAHPVPARHRGRAPSPHPGRQPRQGGSHHRIGGRARGPPRRPPPGLWRGRHQSLPGLRDAGRHDSPGPAPRARPGHGGHALHQGAQQGRAQGHLQDGDLHHPVLSGRPDLRGHRAGQGLRGPLLHLDRLADRRRGHRRHRRGDGGAPRQGLPRPAGGRCRAGVGRRVPVAAGGRVSPLQPGHGVQAPARHSQRPVPGVQGLYARGRRADPQPRHAARALHPQAGGPQPPARGGGAGGGHPHPLRHRSDVLRVHQPRGARDARHRHEPHGRQVQYRRGRRGFRPLHAGRQRRFAAERDQAGGVRPLRRHQRVPGQRRRSPDQDGPGRQARRGRPAPGPQGVSVDRQGAVLDAGGGADLAAPPPRHLLDRGPGAAHPRPQERQPESADQREAGGGGGGGHGGGGRGQGALRRGPHLRPRRGHRRLSPHLHQARGRALGAGARGDAAGARAEQAARPHHRAGGRPAEDRPRRGDRGAAGRGGVWLLHCAAGGDGLHHDAGLPPQYLPGGHRHPGPAAPGKVRGESPSSSRTSSATWRRRCAS
jgi:hypothetical protein